MPKFFIGMVMRRGHDIKNRRVCLPQAGALTIDFSPLDIQTFSNLFLPNYYKHIKYSYISLNCPSPYPSPQRGEG